LKPALLAGAWVALEDVHPDAGPLFYYPGSHHRVRKHLFANGTVLAEGDGPHVRAFEEYLQNECESLGLDRVLFMPKKGDVLIWHSALVHGGSPRANLDLTRKSMVSHYSTAEAYPFDRRSPAAKPLTITRNGEAYYGLQREGHEEGQFPLKR
jgi:ectoine hydroxylase-related dioxygenase (phytanoyl-CoA dioxygenase family)